MGAQRPLARWGGHRWRARRVRVRAGHAQDGLDIPVEGSGEHISFILYFTQLTHF